jgi:hypothetical protein
VVDEWRMVCGWGWELGVSLRRIVLISVGRVSVGVYMLADLNSARRERRHGVRHWQEFRGMSFKL